MRSLLPFQYAAKCKRNTANGLPFLVDNVLDDLVIILLAFISVFPLVTDFGQTIAGTFAVLLAISCLHFSLWVIYEAGYVDNDRVSATQEAEVKVSDRFAEMDKAYKEPLAWAWALGLGLFGSILTVLAKAMPDASGSAVTLPEILTVLAIWVGALVALRLCYHVYNRVDKMSRIYLYLPLQIIKYAFPALFFFLPAIGAVALFAQIARRWVPYIVYRFSLSKPGKFPARLLRLLIFLTLFLLLIAGDLPKDQIIAGLIITVWFTLRGASQILRALRQMKPVAKDDWTLKS